MHQDSWWERACSRIRPQPSPTGARTQRPRHLLAALLLAPGIALADGPFILDASEWARPRSGEVVAAMPTVREAVHIWSQTPSAELAIRHPRGEAGVLWAEELRDWLVALGVPSAGIELRASSGLEGRVQLDIRRASGGST